jgi:N-acetylmuramoyl-L-alanine amidase
MANLNLNELIQVDFPEDQYFKEETNKNQIVLHHTVSGGDALGDINYWKSNPDKVATAIVADRSGKIYQCYSTKYWAYHLGLKTSSNVPLNKGSIGIEIDSWGGLVKHTDGNWYPAVWDTTLKKYTPNLKVKAIENVVEFTQGFRGFYGFEKYTDAQIESVRKLLVFWNEKYKIPLKYNSDMWDISQKALNGESGVWTHVSYRSDKSDCYPDERLIAMLKSL